MSDILLVEEEAATAMRDVAVSISKEATDMERKTGRLALAVLMQSHEEYRRLVAVKFKELQDTIKAKEEDLRKKEEEPKT